MNKSLIQAAVALGLAAIAGGCEYRSVVITDPGRHEAGSSLGAPSGGSISPAEGSGQITLNSLDANPTNVAARNDKITFTVNAHNANRLPMEYSWAATKGTLSATRGQTVFWTPQKGDGQVETGLATVQVLITDADGATKQAAVNLVINADGSAYKQ